MAVVQISKIQIRRGQKNSNTGVPQLSSAELAWAVDTQELFIGNGSVAEGAPTVGNTKVLTENDNIIELASSYRFGSTEPSITESVNRALSEKIDDIEVSVADFGANGDGSTDNVAAFESALQQLFANADTNFRKILKVPNGEYLFTSDIEIPSNAIIQGETQLGTVLNIGANNILFTTTDGQQVGSFTSSNRPENISISNLTIERTTGQTVFTGVKNSSIERVSFKGNYVLGDSVGNITTEPGAVFWQNNLIGIKVDNLTFRQCNFSNNSIGLKCSQDSIFETRIYFDETEFNVLDTGIYIDGVTDQVNNWEFVNCRFEELARQAFNSTAGKGTTFNRCNFVNVGNGVSSAAFPETEIISFGQSDDNVVLNCSTNRLEQAVLTGNSSDAAVTEVLNGSKVTLSNSVETNIFLSDSFSTLAVLSAENKFYDIHYSLRLSTEIRHGTLKIIVNEPKTAVTIADESNYSAVSATSSEGQLMTGFLFNVTIADNDADSGNDTVILSYKNPLATGSTGSIALQFSYGV